MKRGDQFTYKGKTVVFLEWARNDQTAAFVAVVGSIFPLAVKTDELIKLKEV